MRFEIHLEQISVFFGIALLDHGNLHSRTDRLETNHSLLYPQATRCVDSAILVARSRQKDALVILSRRTEDDGRTIAALVKSLGGIRRGLSVIETRVTPCFSQIGNNSGLKLTIQPNFDGIGFFLGSSGKKRCSPDLVQHASAGMNPASLFAHPFGSFPHRSEDVS